MLSRWMPRPSKPLRHRNGSGGFDSHTFPPFREETLHFAGFFLAIYNESVSGGMMFAITADFSNAPTYQVPVPQQNSRSAK